MHWRRKWQPTPVFLPENSRDGGTWWAAVCGVTQSQTGLKRLSSSSSSIFNFTKEKKAYQSFIYLSCCFEEFHLFAINLFTDMVVFKLSISLFVLYYYLPPILSYFQFLILPYFGLIIFLFRFLLYYFHNQILFPIVLLVILEIVT